MRFLFVMDAPAHINARADTSFAWIEEFERRGHLCDHALIGDLGIEEGRAFVWAHAARAMRDDPTPLRLERPAWRAIADYDAVFIRKNPPFEENYLWATLVLELEQRATLIINEPRGLREANEKLYACRFPKLMPPTLVSSNAAEIHRFIEAQQGLGVIKPLDGRGGEGVMLISTKDVNLNAIVEMQTRFGARMVMVQRYLPEIEKGDKRILLLEGRVLGVMRRIPKQGDIRSNLHIGGRAEACTIEADDQHIVDTLAPSLKEHGLYFVGLDVIAGKLTEVNVTSPTGIQQMSALTNRNLSADFADWLEQKVKQKGRQA